MMCVSNLLISENQNPHLVIVQVIELPIASFIAKHVPLVFILAQIHYHNVHVEIRTNEMGSGGV